MDSGEDLAIIGGSGELPLIIKSCFRKAVSIFFNKSKQVADEQVIYCEFEKLGLLFEKLNQNGIRRVVMAGAITRPQFQKSKMDDYTLNLLPKLQTKLAQGDNELLSFIADEFEKKRVSNFGCF